MKPLAALAVTLVLALNPVVFAQSSQQLLTEAQRAYIAGNMESAKEKFKTVLERDPDNVAARNYLHMIETAEKKEGNGLEKQLQGVVLPKVEFKDATLGSALDYLKQQVAKTSGGKTQVSFVLQLPPDVAENAKVSLSLANIPFLEALKYLCGLTNVEYKIDKYAVVIRPAGSGTSAGEKPAQ